MTTLKDTRPQYVITDNTGDESPPMSHAEAVGMADMLNAENIPTEYGVLVCTVKPYVDKHDSTPINYPPQICGAHGLNCTH